ncbi:alpha/beta fold hydrolase [Chitinophaga sp. SYP-B3965]|uniref:alpha/beta fold hydrolase n=1 Tax=Chitinophaga sp. SYP-B3965 TaxID=2663120 RepID=UPI001299D2BD|nr:alpha/beta fold hydrolase [Chitinophaga sp. SYP-B3965]MRG44108.1 alpha/beta fold hydrolase [Chitinophaga sp. SYP-B3965]
MTHAWLNRSEYPFHSKYYTINGHKLHYIDEGRGEIILFVHGTPSWSFDFRHIIKEAKDNYRCIALDHIGFGLSDKPAEYDYSTINHSRTLEKFILEKGLENITLVVHDFGGPIALNFAIQYPEKIKNIVIMNSWLWRSPVSKILKSPLLPFLYRYLNFSPKVLLSQSFGDNKLASHLKAQYTKPFANKSQRNGALAFARSLLNDQDWFEEALWNKKETIANKPTLFIWGMKDPFIKPAHLDKFQTGFPNSTTLKLETAGHFPQEEQPETVTRTILKFLSLSA